MQLRPPFDHLQHLIQNQPLVAQLVSKVSRTYSIRPSDIIDPNLDLNDFSRLVLDNIILNTTEAAPAEEDSTDEFKERVKERIVNR